MNAISTVKTALFPGTFDPVTLGHIDIIRRATELFDQLVVAIGSNPEKRELFSLDERLAMIREALADEDLSVRVESYDGLTVDYARQIGAAAIVRGIRNYTDLQFEFQLALTNRAVADVETVFIMAGELHGFTSSTLIKQIAASGRIEHLRTLLPEPAIRRLRVMIEQGHVALTEYAQDQHKE